MAYDKVQQTIDTVIIDTTIGALSARSIGEKKDFCEKHVQDYIRISRFWSEKRFFDSRKQTATLHMFLDLAENAQISAFSIAPYEKLLKETRRVIKAKIFMRRKQKETCDNPVQHVQKCFCGNMARGVAAMKVGE